jgi:hypothetical protein
MFSISYAVHRLRQLPRMKLAAVCLVGATSFGFVGSYALHAMTKSLASAAMDRMGDPNKVLDKLADKLVDRLQKRGGAIEAVKRAIVQRLAEMAGKKLNGVDIDKLLADAKGDLVAGGLDKIGDVNVDTLLTQMRTSLSTTASKKIDALDLEAIVEKIVREKVDELEAEARAEAKAYYETHKTEYTEKYYEPAKAEYKTYEENNGSSFDSLFGLLTGN